MESGDAGDAGPQGGRIAVTDCWIDFSAFTPRTSSLVSSGC